ncbi:MAG TPA: hypothetical protein VGW10_12990, partial [Solirubrobacteraceae bacterium]|nr:hypothetical protein [Solirubrobacteraceae bacterium]
MTAALAASGTASAAVGDIGYDGCVGNTGANGCFDLPATPLGNVADVAVSPDGKSVYAVSQGTNSVAHFFRAPQGQIVYDGCLNNDGSEGCGNLPGEPLTSANGVAVSPDGKSVYVASGGANSITHFLRAPAGQIVYQGCLANDDTAGCEDVAGAPLHQATDVALSPDGTSVYVASRGSDAVVHFARGPAFGELAYNGCYANGDADGCADIPEAPIDEARGVAVSPDGRSVYVTAQAGGSVGHLFRGTDGRLQWDGCLNNTGSQNCADVPSEPLADPWGVAVSPDGKSVYVASVNGGTVAHLFRAPGGQIAWDGCLSSDGSLNCADVPGDPLVGAAQVAVSADGRSVYAASLASDSVAHLKRTGADGQIEWGGCAANTGSGGCTDLPGEPLDVAQSVAVAPDGGSVYVGTLGSDTVAHFFREPVTAPAPAADPQPPVAEPQPDTTPAGTPGDGPLPAAADTLAPTLSRVALTRRRFRAARGTTLRFTVSEAATVRVVVERLRRGGRVARRVGTLVRTAAAGSARLR